MPRPPHRVLMLAYLFPPLGGAGVQRSLKFAKYLPRHGWQPTVITTSSRAYPVADESLVADVPDDLRVVRAAEVPGYDWLRDQIGKVFDLLGAEQLVRLTRWPDDMAAWGPPALRQTLREISRERPDVLFSSSAPFTAHAVALAAHRLTGIPWVADFRDEWSTNPHVASQGRVIAHLSRRAERAFCRHATRLVVAADYFDLPLCRPERRVTITNGVDPDDLAGLPAADPPLDRFRLTYVGTLYGERDAAPVLRALGRLVARGLLDPSRIELRIVGNVWLPARHWLVATSETGYVDHARALAEMAEATALLLYVPPGSLAPGGKLYEYLVSGRPVLAVAPAANLASELVEDWKAGRAAPPEDEEAIETAILELYRSWEAGTLAVSPDVRERTLERFGRDRLAGRLAEVLADARAASVS